MSPFFSSHWFRPLFRISTLPLLNTTGSPLVRIAQSSVKTAYEHDNILGIDNELLIKHLMIRLHFH